MKIALINQPWNTVTLPVETGSIAIWNYEVARRLSRTWEVVVYAKKDWGQKRVEWDQHVQYRRFPITQDIWCQRVARRMGTSVLRRFLAFDSTWYYLGFILRVATDLRKRKFDVIHIHNFSQFVPIIRLFSPDSKIVLHMHCEWLTEIAPRVIKRRLHGTDAIVGCSSYIAETIRGALPGYAQLCRPIHNGVDVEHFRPRDGAGGCRANDDKTVLFVGRVSPEKGVHVLLKAFQQVLHRFPDTRLEIVGPPGAVPREFVVELSRDPKVMDLKRFYKGDYVAGLVDELSSCVGSRVAFNGLLNYMDMADHYRNADMLVCPSVWNEPFGLPVVEAMACGIPVIGTRSGGIQETVKHDETGLLVERGNVTELVEAMLFLLGHPGRGESMGKAGRARAVELFSWERVVSDLNLLYSTLVEKAPQ